MVTSGGSSGKRILFTRSPYATVVAELEEGWDIWLKDSGMELRGWEGYAFAIDRKVNSVYPIVFKVMTPRLAAWMDNGRRDSQRARRMSRGVDMTATAKGGKGNKGCW